MSGSVFVVGIPKARALVVLLVALVVAGFLAVGMSVPAHADSPGTLNVRVSNAAGELITGLDVGGDISAIPIVNNEPQVANSIDGVAVDGVPGEYTFALVGGQKYAIAILNATGGISELYSSSPVSGYGDGYFDDADLVSVATGATQYLDFSVVSNVSLKGKVTNSSNKSAGSAVFVEAWRFDGSNWIDWQQAQTSSSGAYSFTGLDAGSYKLSFTDYSTTGYLSVYSGGASTLAAASATYIGIGGSATVNAKLATGGKITGKVTYLADKVTAADGIVPFAYPVVTNGSGGIASVDKSTYYFGADTSSSGIWTVPALPTGSYIVKLYDDTDPTGSLYLTNSYVGASGPVAKADSAKVFSVTAGKTTSSGLTTQLALVSGDTSTPLTLTVNAPGGTTPLSNAFVTLSSTDDNDYYFSSSYNATSNTWANLTATDGTVAFPRAPQGNYKLTVDYTSANPLDYGEAGYTASDQPYVETFAYDPATMSTKSITMSALDALRFTTAPSISNSGNLAAGVSHTVSAVAAPSGAVASYEWLRDGKPIYGATSATYVTQGGDVSHAVTALVTYTLDGFSPVAESASLGTIIVGPTITAAAAPAISSSTTTATPGSTLSASTGSWLASGQPLAGVTTTTNWFVSSDGFSVSVGTGSTYVVTAAEADAGDTIEAKVTASKPGYVASSGVTTNQLAISPLPKPTVTKAPKVTAKKIAAGTQYTVSTGSWSATGLTFSYEWDANGVVVNTASNIYDVDSVNAAQDLVVKVTATKPGTASGTATVLAAKGTAGPTPAGGGVYDATSSSSVDAGDSVVVGDVLNLTSFPPLWDYPDGTSSPASTVKWERNGKAISGATKSVYVVTSSDVGAVLTALVTSTSGDYGSSSESLAAGTGVVSQALVSAAPSVTISGTETAGSTLTATVGLWQVSGVTVAPQWYVCVLGHGICGDPTDSDFGAGKNYTPISKATKLTLATTLAQNNDEFVIKVTGSKAGYASYTATSTPWEVASTQIRETSLPVVSGLTGGHAKVGTTLKVSTGAYDVPGVTLHYLWLECDVATSSCGTGSPGFHQAPGAGATTSTYKVTGADWHTEGSELIAQVTASKTGYTSLVLPSNGYSTLQGDPTATRKATLKTTTSSYTVTPPNWTPTGGYPVYYQWDVNGSSVLSGSDPSDATLQRSSSYAGKAVVVTVSYEAAPTSGYGLVSTVVVAQKGTASVASTSDVTLSGSTLGDTFQLSGNPFTYAASPDGGVTTTYQWYEGSTAIKASAGGTVQYYAPPASYVGKAIKVKVTATNAEWNTATFTSKAVTLLAGTGTGAPTISGTPKPGDTLTAVTTSYTSGATPSFVWSFEPSGSSTFTAISKATKSTYVALPTQAGGTLRVTVTAKKTGYTFVTQHADIAVQFGDALTSYAPASISGGAASVGSLLTADPGTWSTTGLTFVYQWQLNGIDIPGATAATFTPLASDYTDDVSVTVTASKPGYQPASSTSGDVTIARGTIPTATTKPKITGTPETGATLTASTGTWPVDALTFTYTWSNGTSTVGTGATFTPSSAGTYTVTVTATRTGYFSGTSTSSSVTVH